jgi:predicted metal-dependent phosphoesterase TrpH
LINIDIHVHTTASPCSIFPPESLVSLAIEKNVPVIVTTNHHDSVGDAKYLSSKLTGHGIKFFPGLEMTNEWGDFLVFGENLRKFQGFMRAFPKNLLPRDDIAVIWAHPYRFYTYEEVEEIKNLVAPYIDAVEGINGNCLRSNPNANRTAILLAKKLGKPAVAGSDAHSPDMFFNAYTRFLSPINSYADFIRAIKEGNLEIG